MAFNPAQASDFSRLTSAAMYARRQLASFRQDRMDVIKESAGKHYGPDSCDYKVRVNMLDLMVGVLTRMVAGGTPKVLFRTGRQELKGTARRFTEIVNQRLQAMNFRYTFRQCVIDSWFGLGICKVGLEMDNDREQPFAERVDFNDWVHDTGAKSEKGLQFCGNRYWMELEEAKMNREFLSTGRAELSPTMQGPTQQNNLEELFPRVELWDLWLPSEGLLVTTGEDFSPLLKVEPWKGHDYGPYAYLRMKEIPDRFMPLGPAIAMWDLNRAVNRPFNRTVEDIDRTKTILAMRAGGTSDVDRIAQSQHGDAVPITNPDKIQEQTLGPIDGRFMAFSEASRNLFSYMAGNLDAMAGLQAQAQTLGQEQLLFAGAGGTVRDYQERALEFAQKVISCIAWYLWTDPNLSERIQKPMGRTGVEVSMKVDRSTLSGSWEDYSFEIDPYSLQTRSPQDRMSMLTSLVERAVMPLQMQMAQQGAAFNVLDYFDMLADYSDIEELRELIIGADQAELATSAMRPTSSRAPAGQNGQQAGPLAEVARLAQSMTRADRGVGA